MGIIGKNIALTWLCPECGARNANESAECSGCPKKQRTTWDTH
jgi:ribosomal protein L40E